HRRVPPKVEDTIYYTVGNIACQRTCLTGVRVHGWSREKVGGTNEYREGSVRDPWLPDRSRNGYLLIECLLFQKGHQGNERVTGRESFIDIVVVVAGQTDLLEVVLALGTVGGLTHLLHGRQQQADEHGNDGDHHQ